MKQLTFITGNEKKAEYLAKWLGMDIEHQKLDLDEIQSLDSHMVVEHKARQAYSLVRRPVLVEDVSLTFTALNHLPGTFIKWFLEDLGLEGLCRLADGLAHRGAICTIIYALFDGDTVHYFEAQQNGFVPDRPRGDASFGWNPIFQPEGSELTYGEMDEDTFKKWNIRAHAIEKLKTYLTNE